MKCPFTFASSNERGARSECDPDCFLRIAVRKVSEDGSKKLQGYTCAIVAMAESDLPYGIELMGRLERV